MLTYCTKIVRHVYFLIELCGNFHVSVDGEHTDYFAGRESCRKGSLLTIGRNLEEILLLQAHISGVRLNHLEASQLLCVSVIE